MSQFKHQKTIFSPANYSHISTKRIIAARAWRQSKHLANHSTMSNLAVPTLSDVLITPHSSWNNRLPLYFFIFIYNPLFPRISFWFDSPVSHMACLRLTICFKNQSAPFILHLIIVFSIMIILWWQKKLTCMPGSIYHSLIFQIYISIC